MDASTCLGRFDGTGAVSLNLQRQALFSLPDASRVRIVCLEGSVWITLDDDQRDVILDACQVFSTTQRRRAIVYALRPSVVHVQATADIRLDARPHGPGFGLHTVPA